jgi:hypothetical protein
LDNGNGGGDDDDGDDGGGDDGGGDDGDDNIHEILTLRTLFNFRKEII